MISYPDIGLDCRNQERNRLMVKFKVTLTEQERDELRALVTAGKAAARKMNHARILLLADEGEFGPGKTDLDIVEALGTSVRTVERVRKRFVEEGTDQAVNPKPQPKRPGKVKIQGKVEDKLVELACSDPPEGRGRWTVQLLADQLVMLAYVESVSHETVRKSLKKRHRSRRSEDMVFSERSQRRVRVSHGKRAQ